jgi:GNAT superfamily N-acetyltransferase
MPFDVAGARSAGYSDAEIASFLAGQAGFDVDGAFKAGYKPAEVVDFLGQASNKGPVTTDDPLTRVDSSTPASDASPSFTPVYDAGQGRGRINPPMPTEAPQTSGSLAKDLAINAFGGAAGTLAGAGAAAADAFGAKDTAASLDQIKQNWEGLQKENGGDAISGKAASLIGAVAPALLVPEAKAVQLVTNAGLFAIPAFRDTLKAKLDAGQSFPLAMAHAAESFGINLFMPTVATHGSGAVVKALGGAEASGAKGAATALTQAAGEGAAFSAANSVLDKGTDVVAGQQNDNDWVNLKDMAASALGFTGLRAAHMAPTAARSVADRVGTQSQQFGRAFGQDVDAAQFADTMPGVRTNPNLADVQADPVAKIAQAGSVDEAIAAAQEAVSSAPSPLEKVATPTGPTVEQLIDKAKSPGLSDEMLALRPLREAAPEEPVAEPAREPAPVEAAEIAPTEAREPTSVWMGRKGSGYLTEADAQMAMPSRQKIAPELDWRVEPVDGGKFRIAGYERAASDTANQSDLGNLAKAQQAAGDAFVNAPPAVHRAEADRIDAAADQMPALPDVQARYRTLAESHRAAADAKEPQAQDAAPEVSRYNGKFGKGMGRDAARLEAARMNRLNDGVTYTAEEHGDPKLENQYAVVGRRMGHELPDAVAPEERAQAPVSPADKTPEERLQAVEQKASKATQPEGEMQDISREQGDRSTAMSLEDVRAKWDASGIKHSLIEKDGTIEVGRIEVPKDQRNAGVGTEAMRQLADYADATGKRITLSPSADFGGNKARLTDFYKRLGFVENKGRNRDFTTRDTMIREPKSPDDFTRSGGVMDRIAQQGYEKAEVPRVQAARRLSTLLERYDNNKISDGMFQLELKMLAHQMADVSATKQANRTIGERERGADLVREKLIRARRQGDLDSGTVDFALWLLDKNPDLASDLGASLRSSDGASAGRYNPAARVMTLFKGRANDGTAVHEILHHSERMMPGDVQKGIVNEWSKAFAKAYKEATPEQRAALDKMAQAMAGSKVAHDAVIDAFKSRTLDYDKHYQLTNPSEYWAVNATRIMGDRYAARSSWVGKARQWMGEMIEKAKGAFGLSSDAAVIKGLKAVLDGDGTFQSKKMLSQSDELGDILRPADAAPKDEERKPYAGPGAKLIHSASDFFSEVRNDAMMKTAPMSATDNRKAQATAQKFANDIRLARVQWEKVRGHIEKNFTPEQREKMWNAADEENVERQKQAADENYVRPEGTGLERLEPDERKAVQTLHEYGEELLKRAKGAGMFEGEGLPYWTPRMAVMIGEDGEVGKIPGGGQRTATDGTGKNISTTASSMKQRKYLTTEETEAAASALAKEKGGTGAKVVRDIMAMPLAMSRLERAIAGRELVNQVKAIGQATGQDVINTTGGEGFVTIPHPAFSTFKPRFAEVDGKTVMAHDQSGEPIFDRVPMYIRKDWEGPLRAVMSTKDGTIYTGYMLLKSKAMSAIMFSPLMHNLVIYGRGLAYSPVKVGSGYLYVKGHLLSKDMDTVRQALKDGVVPLGGNRSSMLDITELAGNVPKMGAWGDPNESWVSLSVQKLGNLLHEGWGDTSKKGLDAAGDFVHHTLLWNLIGKLQLGIYADAKQHFVGKGLSEEAAGTLAAHFANRYGGIVAGENMSEMARKTANVLMFSRSFNMVNLGTIKDVFTGLPTGLKAQLFERVGEAEGAKAVNVARRKAFAALTLDLGFALMLTSLVQDLVDHFKRDKSFGDIGQGYVDRLQSMVKGIGEHPFTRDTWNPYRLSSTWANEPGKKNRIDMGPNVGDRHEYMRLPTGKVVEDLIGWVFAPGETFSNKMSPIAKSVWQAVENDKGFGVPVRDPNGTMAKQAYDTAKHLLKSEVPADSLKQLYDTVKGRATDLDKDKLVGSLTGFTYSQGHPGGPEAAVNAVTQERFDAAKKYVMQGVKDDLKAGDADAAIQKMQDIGMTPREIRAAIGRVESPRSGLSKQSRQNFERRANQQERDEMDMQRSRVR